MEAEAEAAILEAKAGKFQNNGSRSVNFKVVEAETEAEAASFKKLEAEAEALHAEAEVEEEAVKNAPLPHH